MSIGPNPVSPLDPAKHENQPIFEEADEYDVKEFIDARLADKGRNGTRQEGSQDVMRDLKTLI